MTTGIERRKFKRLDLDLPMQAKRVAADDKRFIEHNVVNVSMGGLCFESSHWKDINPNEEMIVSISVPKDKVKFFPFSRIVGKARVVRVVDSTLDEPSKQIALEFCPDVLYLNAST